MFTMTAVLVHGNPETEAIWGPLVDALGRSDVVRLSPPGFGAPLADDFPATYLAYRDWLERELAQIEEPIDLVGHDWGGGHVVNAVMHRPELVRSWASDVVGLFDPDYVWHDLAQVWQTPGDGEELVNTMLGGTLEDRAGQMAALGIPMDIATSAAQGPEMGRAILLLYRSARQPEESAVLVPAGRAVPRQRPHGRGGIGVPRCAGRLVRGPDDADQEPVALPAAVPSVASFLAITVGSAVRTLTIGAMPQSVMNMVPTGGSSAAGSPSASSQLPPVSEVNTRSHDR